MKVHPQSGCWAWLANCASKAYHCMGVDRPRPWQALWAMATLSDWNQEG